MRDVVATLFKRQRIVLHSVILAGFFTLVYVLSIGDSYRSQAMLLAADRGESPAMSSVNAEMQLLRTPALASEVVERLGPEHILNDRSDDTSVTSFSSLVAAGRGWLREHFASQGQHSGSFEQAMKVLQRNMTTSIGPTSTVINLSYVARSAEQAKTVTQAIVDAYMRSHAALRSSMIPLKYATEETERLSSELSRAENDLERFERSVGIVSFNDQLRGLIAQLGAVETEMGQIDADAASSRATLAALKNQSPVDMVSLRQEEIRNASLTARQEVIAQQRRQLERRLDDLRASSLRHEQLEREVENRKTSYDRQFALLEQLKLVPMLGAAQIMTISVMQPPTSPLGPEPKGRVQKMILGVLVGLSIGVLLSLLLERLGSQITTPEDLRSLLAVGDDSACVSVPMVRRRRSRQVAVRERTMNHQPSTLEAGRSSAEWLRTVSGFRLGVDSIWPWLSIERREPSQEPCIVAVTSSTRGEGVTTCAVALSAQSGSSGGLVIEIATGRKVGVSAWRVSCHGKMRRMPLLVGSTEQNSDKTLVSTRMREAGGPIDGERSMTALIPVIREMSDRLIVLDLPPVQAGSVSFELARAADRLIYVVEADRTSSRTVKSALRNLSRLGISVSVFVLNKRRYHLPKWLYTLLQA